MIGEYLFEDLAKDPHRGRVRERAALPQPDHRGGHRRRRGEPVGRDRRHAAALHEAKDRGALALGVVNVVGLDDQPRDRRGRLPARRPEIGVASTKAFTGQVACSR
jgi:glucosamine--fructose-6-phosphate aminotransferase (isomerizing)